MFCAFDPQTSNLTTYYLNRLFPSHLLIIIHYPICSLEKRNLCAPDHQHPLDTKNLQAFMCSEASGWPFKKPVDSVPTRFLIITGAGEAPEPTFFLDPSAPFSASYRHPSLPILALEFASENDAMALRSRFDGLIYKTRALSVRYCARRPHDAAPPSPREAQTPAVRDARRLGIPGLALIPDFVTPEAEAALLHGLAGGPWAALAKRRVQHHLREFDYGTRSFGAPLAPAPPAFLQPAVAAVEAAVRACDPESAAIPWTVDQITANEYGPGVGLAPHVDTHAAFQGAIVSLSLEGGTVMEFRREGEHRALYLPPRSLLVMAGEARYAWAHYIPHRRSEVVEGERVDRGPRRVSLTLRMVRPGPCACAYPQFCDSQLSPLPPTRLAERHAGAGTAAVTHSGPFGEDMVAPGNATPAAPTPTPTPAPPAARAPEVVATETRAALEERFVHQVYEAIAPHFSATRFAVWPEVRTFLDRLPPGALVADVGCGNGKYLGVRPDVAVLGSDRSAGLVQLAHQRVRGEGATAALSTAGRALHHCDAFVADGMGLPYRSGAFDAVICIAVLHHISSPARRVEMLRELVRLLRPGGQALVTVWATEQQDARKLAKWRPIDIQEGREAGGEGEESDEGAEDLGPPRDARAVPGDVGGDYFVPWHLPLHRAEAAAAASAAASPSAPPGAPASATVLDQAKQAVVFQRYYHLFTGAEVEGLAKEVGEGSLVRCFYDKDNWGLILERNHHG